MFVAWLPACLPGCQVNDRKLPELDPKLGYGLSLADEAHLLVQPNWRVDLFKEKKGRQQDSAALQR